MNNLKFSLKILSLIGVVLMILYIYFYTDILIHIKNWIFSRKEEKIQLTKSKGYYNANGYLISSDSDFHLASTGSFKRFEPVDQDVKITIETTNLNGVCGGVSMVSPPPQLPVIDPPTPTLDDKLIHSSTLAHFAQKGKEKSLDGTSISPIPRPVSSINIKALAAQSSFPVNITPPPSPLTPSPSANLYLSKFSPPQQQSSLQEAVELEISPGNSNIEQGGFATIPSSSDEADVISAAALKRALSCESVCSDTSVALADLEKANVTGHLCIGLEYDSVYGELIVNVLEAKDLNVSESHALDSYVRVFLLPDKEATIQTKIYRSPISPSYRERFLFNMHPREQPLRTLVFQVYTSDNSSHTLVGEGDIRLADISLKQPATTWVTLTDTGQKGTEFGELMFSISYLPTAERLTVVVVKARNLKFQSEIGSDSFVKVYLMQDGRKVQKKKTTTKKSEKSPIFNESMMFSVPIHTLSAVQLRLTVAEPISIANSRAYPIGHVIVGSQATGRSLSHWNQMLAVPRKPIAMWHSLRK